MGKGVSGISNDAKYLLDLELEVSLGYLKFQKQCWLRAVEAARGMVPLSMLDVDSIANDNEYEPSRKMLCRWMSTGIM